MTNEKETNMTEQTDVIAVCEFETTPFMVFETDAIDRYRCRIEGIPDCFDCYSVDNIREFGLTDVREHVRYLREWCDHIEELHADLHRLGDGSGLTTPAARYMDLESEAWRNAREKLVAAVMTHLEADAIPFASICEQTRNAWRR